MFYFCHLGYVLFAVLLILHAPNFSYFFPVVGVFVVLDIIERILFGRKKTYVVTGMLLPSDTICLALKKTDRLAFKSGDWVSLKIPTIAKFEWHAFTISSSPELPNVLTLHIKVVGSWTRALQTVLNKDYKQLEKNDRVPIRGSNKTLSPKNSQLAKIVTYEQPKVHLEKSGHT